MILTILFAILLIAGVVILIINYKLDPWGDGLWFSGIISLTIGSIAIIVICVLIIANNNSIEKKSANLWYEETVQSLTIDFNYITENIQDDKAKSVAIIEYNSKVKSFKLSILQHQEILKNPWVNWMNCYEYNNMDVNAVNYIK